MSTISKAKKAERFHKIYETMYDDPEIRLPLLKKKLNLYKNSLKNNLNEMYNKKILNGPFLSIKPHETYKEYMYLIWCNNPSEMCEDLATDAHVLYITRGFGDWNIIVVATQFLDFSRCEYTVIHRGVRYGVYTSKVNNGSQHTNFKEVRYQFYNNVVKEKKERTVVPGLFWGEDEWKLFHVFRDNIRRKVNSILQEYDISYGAYRKWKHTLKDHCTFHIEYYPDGSNTYLKVYLLFETDYEESIKQYLNLLSTSNIYVEIGNSLLAVVSLHPNAINRIFRFFHELKSRKIVKRFRPAVFLINKNYKENGGKFDRKRFI